MFPSIQYCAKVMQTNLSFVLATEDVSKSSKRKNHDLSRKFEIANFKVANLRGKQKKIQDTKFEAANCCNMNRSS